MGRFLFLMFLLPLLACQSLTGGGKEKSFFFLSLGYRRRGKQLRKVTGSPGGRKKERGPSLSLSHTHSLSLSFGLAFHDSIIRFSLFSSLGRCKKKIESGRKRERERGRYVLVLLALFRACLIYTRARGEFAHKRHFPLFSRLGNDFYIIAGHAVHVKQSPKYELVLTSVHRKPFPNYRDVYGRSTEDADSLKRNPLLPINSIPV